MTSNEMIAQEIWHKIFKNLYGRAAFDHWWDKIDQDIQEEIHATIETIITKILDKES